MSGTTKTSKLDSVPDTKTTGKKRAGKVREETDIIPVKMGRPSKYTEELAEELCAQIAEGRSLRSIVRDDESFPDLKTIFNWFRVHEDFLQQYTRAKEESADSLADDIQDISEKVLSGVYDPQAARVAMDGKKWIAAKLKPKKYGDKLDLTSGGEKLPQPILAHPTTLPSSDTSEIIEGELVDPIKQLEEETS